MAWTRTPCWWFTGRVVAACAVQVRALVASKFVVAHMQNALDPALDAAPMNQWRDFTAIVGVKNSAGVVVHYAEVGRDAAVRAWPWLHMLPELCACVAPALTKLYY